VVRLRRRYALPGAYCRTVPSLKKHWFRPDQFLSTEAGRARCIFLPAAARVRPAGPFVVFAHFLERGSRMGSDPVILNQQEILANQKNILENQAKLSKMLSNQAAIVANQESILANQSKLDKVLANQATLMANQETLQDNQEKILHNQQQILNNQGKIINK
jgi:hypothetical protein